MLLPRCVSKMRVSFLLVTEKPTALSRPARGQETRIATTNVNSRTSCRSVLPLINGAATFRSRSRSRSVDRGALQIVRMGIKAVESYDGSFELSQESEEALMELLNSELFSKQVVRECGLEEGTKLEFTQKLFQPLPWSPTTTKGMPQEFESYSDDPNYTIINVPPNFMFQAKIFKPSRLCAIYKAVE